MVIRCWLVEDEESFHHKMRWPEPRWLSGKSERWDMNIVARSRTCYMWYSSLLKIIDSKIRTPHGFPVSHLLSHRCITICNIIPRNYLNLYASCCLGFHRPSWTLEGGKKGLVKTFSGRDEEETRQV